VLQRDSVTVVEILTLYIEKYSLYIFIYKELFFTYIDAITADVTL